MVWVLKNGRAQMRMVQTGLTNDEVTEIVSGVSPGDIVITSGFEDLQDGSPVQPVDSNGNPIRVPGSSHGSGMGNMPQVRPQNKKPNTSMPGMKM
jgi:hypothetical protein